jgi:hypothetical protein
VYLDALRPHVIFICGKRGYGKSYTIGVFLEEIAGLEDDVKQNLGVVVLDTLGIYWTTRFPSNESFEKIMRWDRRPQGFPVRLLVPEHAISNYSKNGISVERFSLRVAELSPMHWCQLFDVKATDPVGIVLTRVVLALQSSSYLFSITEILSCIQQDERTTDLVKGAVENFFIMAESWGIFDTEGLSITDLVRRGTLTVLDLSVLQSPVLKDIVVALVCEKSLKSASRNVRFMSRKKWGSPLKKKVFLWCGLQWMKHSCSCLRAKRPSVKKC